MAESMFGVGWLTALTTATTPVATRFGRLQDVSVDFSFELKQLYGAQQFPVEQARGKAKIDIKATLAALDPIGLNNVFLGQTAAAGELLSSVDEVGTVPGSAGYTVTVANSANFSTDLGVYNYSSGLWLTRVVSAPAAGQYSVAAGVYAFNAAQANASVRMSYTYGSATTGTTITGTNQLMGASPTFGLVLVNSFVGVSGKKSLYVKFPYVVASKTTFPFKLDDFALPQIEMSAQDDGSGNVFSWSMTG
jgi:hypothetical protein